MGRKQVRAVVLRIRLVKGSPGSAPSTRGPRCGAVLLFDLLLQWAPQEKRGQTPFAVIDDFQHAERCLTPLFLRWVRLPARGLQTPLQGFRMPGLNSPSGDL